MGPRILVGQSSCCILHRLGENQVTEKTAETMKTLEGATISMELAERLDLEHADKYPDSLIKRHKARYDWARDRIRSHVSKALNTLDFACGTGYGSEILAAVTKNYIGCDVSEKAIKQARKLYAIAGAEYYVASAREIPNKPYEAIVCIETIEHLPERDVKDFLLKAYNNITQRGVLLISTPRRTKGDIYAKPDNPFHLREYLDSELDTLLEEHGFYVFQHDRWMPGFIHMVVKKKQGEVQ